MIYTILVYIHQRYTLFFVLVLIVYLEKVTMKFLTRFFIKIANFECIVTENVAMFKTSKPSSWLHYRCLDSFLVMFYYVHQHSWEKKLHNICSQSFIFVAELLTNIWIMIALLHICFLQIILLNMVRLYCKSTLILFRKSKCYGFCIRFNGKGQNCSSIPVLQELFVILWNTIKGQPMQNISAHSAWYLYTLQLPLSQKSILFLHWLSKSMHIWQLKLRQDAWLWVT